MVLITPGTGAGAVGAGAGATPGATPFIASSIAMKWLIKVELSRLLISQI